MKLYLSGKISGNPDFIQDFAKNEKLLTDTGYSVLNPTKLTQCADSYCLMDRELGTSIQSEYPHTWECYMKYALRALLFCDGLALMSDALQSRGSRLELMLSGELKLDCNTIKGWIRHGEEYLGHAYKETRVML